MSDTPRLYAYDESAGTTESHYYNFRHPTVAEVVAWLREQGAAMVLESTVNYPDGVTGEQDHFINLNDLDLPFGNYVVLKEEVTDE